MAAGVFFLTAMQLTKTFLTLLFVTIVPCAFGQWEVESDPIAFGLNGYSFHAAHSAPDGHGRVQVGVFGAESPSTWRIDDGVNERSRGVTLKYDHFFSARRKGFFVGADSTWSRTRYRDDTTGDSASRNGFALGPRAGYRFEIGRHLYITPWVSAGYAFNAGDVALAGRTLHQRRLQVFPTVHVGWRF